MAEILVVLGLLVLLVGFYRFFGADRDVWSQVSALLLLVLALTLILSVLSFHPGEGPGENLGGILGHFLGGALVHLLGKPYALLLLLGVALTGGLTLGRALSRSRFAQILAWLLALFFGSAFLRLFLGFPVGVLQETLLQELVRLLGRIGALLFVFALGLAPLIPLYRPLRPPFRRRRTFPRLRLPRLRRAAPSIAPEEAPEEERGQETVAVPLEEPERPPRVPERNGKGRRRRAAETPQATPPEPQVSQEALLSLLSGPLMEVKVDEEECKQNARLIEEKLEEFGIRGRVVTYSPGPVVTRYEYEPAPGVKLSRITGLADDLALRMKSEKIRIVAPLPRKGRVGIEVPNRERRIVYFRDMVAHPEFQKMASPLAFALGVDTAGFPVYADLTRMPHLLIAGTTGSGKSVCLNALITSVLFRATPQQVRFVLVDPKIIELSLYEGLPHLLRPVVKNSKEAVFVLKQAVRWMELRYQHLARDGVRDIEDHNRTLKKRRDPEFMPYIVIVIDEFADLYLTSGRHIEEPFQRLAQMARAVGIHLVVATQRPTVDVITGTIKANFPVRIAFKVASKVDSKTILDMAGAEKLLGKGDMLFIPPGSSEPVRLHGPLITGEEVRRIVARLIEGHLRKRLEEVFGEFPGMGGLIERILEEGWLPALTREDEPGGEEKLAQVARQISRLTGVEEEEAGERLLMLRERYYEPIAEVEEVPVRPVGEVEEEIEGLPGELDPLLPDAAMAIAGRKHASATFLQRRLKVGFARAARIMDQMESLGIVGPGEGSKPRKVLKSPEEIEALIRRL